MGAKSVVLYEYGPGGKVAARAAYADPLALRPPCHACGSDEVEYIYHSNRGYANGENPEIWAHCIQCYEKYGKSYQLNYRGWLVSELQKQRTINLTCSIRRT